MQSSTDAMPVDGYPIDDTPLTKEEEEEIAKIEGSQPNASIAHPPSPASPTRKKRKRANSASPHLTPSRLRSSVRVTTRAMDAGYKPNSKHTFRQEPPAEPLLTVSDNSHLAARPSEPKVPTAQPPGGAGNAGDPQGVPMDDVRRSLSIGPAAPLPNAQPEAEGHARSTGENAGSYHQHPQMATSVDDARRSLSTGPSAPQLIVQPGAYGYPGGISDHAGPYHMQMQMPPSGMPPQYGGYPGMSGPASYFHPHASAYSAPPPPQFYQQPPFLDQKPPRFSKEMEMPTEAPNPSTNVFSSLYAPVDHGSAQGAQPQPSSTLPAPAQLDSTLTHEPRSTDSTPRKPTSSDATQRPTLKSPTAPAAVPVSDLVPMQISSLPSTPVADIRSHSPNSDCSDIESNVVSGVEESPTIGRMSNATRKALKEGFAELDACIQRVSANTGLNPAQIVERWDVTKTRVANSWNIYQGFFEEKRDQELARLDPKDCPQPGAIPAKAIVSACYDHFKLAEPDTYDSILRSWYRLRLINEGGAISLSKRGRDFRKHTEKIEALIRHGSSHFGFESVCITVGGVINQDHSIAQVLESDAAVDFFAERYHSSDNQALGLFKAHVYDRLAKRVIPKSKGEEPSSVIVKTEQTVATAGGETTVPSIHDLKEKFITLTARYKITVTKGQSLIWKALPHAIAEAGCVLHNWPEDVPFPCDESQSGKTSKGISILKNPARVLLFAAFDLPSHPLRLEKKFKGCVPVDEPVIIGVPPSASSPHTHGRRKFLDDKRNEDRKGPARLKITTTDTASPQKAPARPPTQKAPPTPSDESETRESAAPKAKLRVHFDMQDDSDNGAYCTSEDAVTQDSGTDDDVPIARSPHRLRSQERGGKGKGNNRRGSTRGAASGRRRQASVEEGDGFEASTANVKANAKTANKKRRVTPAAAPVVNSTTTADPTPSVVEPTTHSAHTNVAALTRKEARSREQDMTDKLAAQLFGTKQQSTVNEKLDSTSASSQEPGSSSTQPNDTPPTAATASHAHQRTEEQQRLSDAQAPSQAATISVELTSPSDDPKEAPSASVTIPHAPRQIEDQQRISHGQAARQEGYYAPQHPTPYSEPSGGYYRPPERHPSNWNMGPVTGWNQPGPNSAGQHSVQGYPPAPAAQGYPAAPPTQGYQPVPPTQGYQPVPPTQGYPPVPPTQGYPPVPLTQGYPPLPTQGYPPVPPTQAYPPLPSTQGYSPAPNAQGYPSGPSTQTYPLAPSAQGYPPAPNSVGQHSAQGAPMGGPGHHPAYWPQGTPFPNPYGYYQPQGAPPTQPPGAPPTQPPGAPPTHPLQDNVPHGQGDAA